LAIDYRKQRKINFTGTMSPSFSTEITEPYNAMLSITSLIEHNDITVLYDNEALFKIGSNMLDIWNPNYRDIN
jgi:tubulin alpha